MNLLVPCAYPNPMPSLAQIHLPVPPLPSQFPPHIIYNFCVSLHSLMLQVEPGFEVGARAGPSAERWALMQRTPGNSQAGPNGGEWFTASVDMRSAERAYDKLREEGGEVSGSLLETLAARGDRFGKPARGLTPCQAENKFRPCSSRQSAIDDRLPR